MHGLYRVHLLRLGNQTRQGIINADHLRQDVIDITTTGKEIAKEATMNEKEILSIFHQRETGIILMIEIVLIVNPFLTIVIIITTPILTIEILCMKECIKQ